MPVKDGIAAAREIAGERLAPVVILTAFSQRDLVEQARDAGAIAYLVKPFQKEELLPAIEVALARHGEMRALEAENASLHDEKRRYEEQLETRRWVDRAKGVLMDEHGLRETEAFGFVQRTAMDRRTTMRDVAKGIVDKSIVPG
jgi:two-component system, response regulator PdtaR